MSDLVLVILLLSLAVFLFSDFLYQRLVIAKHLTDLEAQLVERQERHRGGWRAVYEALDSLVRYSQKNKLASLYVRARTEMRLYGMESYQGRQLVLSSGSPYILSEMLNIHREIMAVLLETYPSVESLIAASAEDISSLAKVDIDTAEEIRRRVQNWLDGKRENGIQTTILSQLEG